MLFFPCCTTTRTSPTITPHLSSLLSLSLVVHPDPSPPPISEIPPPRSGAPLPRSRPRTDPILQQGRNPYSRRTARPFSSSLPACTRRPTGCPTRSPSCSKPVRSSAAPLRRSPSSSRKPSFGSGGARWTVYVCGTACVKIFIFHRTLMCKEGRAGGMVEVRGRVVRARGGVWWK